MSSTGNACNSRNASNSRNTSNSRNASNSMNASNSRNAGNSTDAATTVTQPAVTVTPVTRGTGRARATLGKVHQLHQDMPQQQGCQQQRNIKTTTGNTRDATNIMDTSNSKEATAGMSVKAV
jgi:hypothetical protein